MRKEGKLGLSCKSFQELAEQLRVYDQCSETVVDDYKSWLDGVKRRLEGKRRHGQKAFGKQLRTSKR